MTETTPLSGTVCRPQAGTCYDQHAHHIWSLQLKPFQRCLMGIKNL